MRSRFNCLTISRGLRPAAYSLKMRRTIFAFGS